VTISISRQKGIREKHPLKKLTKFWKGNLSRTLHINQQLKGLKSWAKKQYLT
jgi:hypothetical protein